MNYVECGNVHIYDSDIYPECPYCNKKKESTIDFAVTEYEYSNQETIGKTVPISQTQSDVSSSEIQKTVATDDYSKKQQEIRKTVGIFSKKNNMDPVAGWIVCVEGPNKGKDYTIKARSNSIGRGSDNVICIDGDDTISRNNAEILYDDKHNAFYLSRISGSTIIYVNDQTIMQDAILEKNDIIQLGESKFRFIPFCDEVFKWD